tara:strand:- start:198 stop:326 length:129 start_codon:yes stop_codon:yes gene_type:complete
MEPSIIEGKTAPLSFIYSPKSNNELEIIKNNSNTFGTTQNNG